MDTTGQHRSTQRVIDILQAIALQGDNGLSLTELATRLDVPKSSLFPIVHTLRENNLISLREQSGKYGMGHKTYELGNAYLLGDSVSANILELMRNISQQCRETCFFAELLAGDAFYLFKSDSPESLRMVGVGKTLPAYSSGIGKALLSDKTQEELRQIYPGQLQAITKNTITDFALLARQLKTIREQDIAFEKEESTPYIQCIAIPIRRCGKVRAALSVAIPVFRYSEQKETMVIGLLKQGQLQIESLIQSNDWSHF